MATTQINESKLPPEFIEFVEKSLEKNGSGGRPSFLQELAKQKDVKEELLNILELAWINEKSWRLIARKYHTGYQTIRRIIQALEPLKEAVVEYLKKTPRRKMFYNKATDSSDYETVQNYINHANRKKLKSKNQILGFAEKVWRFLGYKDPTRWDIDSMYKFLDAEALSPAKRNRFIDGIRAVAPQTRDKESPHYLETEREKIQRRKKEIFFNEIQLILTCLEDSGLAYHALIFKLHITLGCREGSKDDKSGLTGLSWDRFKQSFTLVDVFEIKVRKGIWWRNCPVDLIFPELPEEIKKIWKQRGKPINGKLILAGYTELLQIYKEIRKTLGKHFVGKLEPSLFNELVDLKPHDADKIHCNLLFEAGADLSDIAGEYKGGSEGAGLMGRGWLNINTIWKYYLTYSARSQRFQRNKRKVQGNCKKLLQGQEVDVDSDKGLDQSLIQVSSRR